MLDIFWLPKDVIDQSKLNSTPVVILKNQSISFSKGIQQIERNNVFKYNMSCLDLIKYTCV